VPTPKEALSMRVLKKQIKKMGLNFVSIFDTILKNRDIKGFSNCNDF
jgi:hypothetical protein